MIPFLLLLLTITLVFLFLQAKKGKTKDQEIALLRTTSEQQITITANREAQLINEIDQLGQYRGILDTQSYADELRKKADNEAASMLSRAQFEADELRQAATDELSRARSAAKEIRDQAAYKARLLQTQADGVLLSATQEANRIVATANLRAEEIAGEALAANRNAANLEKTIQALKNVINGYGDQYLVPSYSLLDEIADEFGYTEAGVELKKARERTRLMITTRSAAMCDYVETIRSISAVNFVTDAFNGKVDTVLAGVKHDNFGTLAQQIKDAYALVKVMIYQFTPIGGVSLTACSIYPTV